MGDLMTIDEVAQYLRVSRDTVTRLLNSGELTRIKLRSRVLIDSADVQALVERIRENGGERGGSA